MTSHRNRKSQVDEQFVLDQEFVVYSKLNLPFMGNYVVRYWLNGERWMEEDGKSYATYFKRMCHFIASSN